MTDIDERELSELRRKALKYDDDTRYFKIGVKVAAGLAVFIIAVILLFRAAGPQLNLYKANTEKQAVIAEQRAVSEAAEFAAKSEVIQAQAKADAEVIRAQGLADSQAIISATLSEEYLRYLYIQQLDENPGQVIYIPTEAGLPILEATRNAGVDE